jgi:hypothetical protein
MGEELENLKNRPNVQITFFSGGSDARNRALLQAIKLPDGSNALQMAKNVEGLTDLTHVSYAGPFTDRFDKDISAHVTSEIENAITVDDKNFHSGACEINALEALLR